MVDQAFVLSYHSKPCGTTPCWTGQQIVNSVSKIYSNQLRGADDLAGNIVKSTSLPAPTQEQIARDQGHQPKSVVYIYIPPCSEYLECALSISSAFGGRVIRGKIRVDERLASGTDARTDAVERLKVFRKALTDMKEWKLLFSGRLAMFPQWFPEHIDIPYLDQRLYALESGSPESPIKLHSAFKDGASAGFEGTSVVIIASPELGAKEFLTQHAPAGQEALVPTEKSVFKLTYESEDLWEQAFFSKFG
jgi:hypothetical protein